MPPAELMKTQTDRKIAEELQRTYDVQREAQVQRQALERETAIANMQDEVVRSEQQVRIAERHAMSVAETARGEATAVDAARRGRGRVAADARRGGGVGDEGARRRRGVGDAGDRRRRRPRRTDWRSPPSAPAATRRCRWRHRSPSIKMKLVPEIAVSGNGASSGLAEAFMARLVAGAQDRERPPQS